MLKGTRGSIFGRLLHVVLTAALPVLVDRYEEPLDLPPTPGLKN